MSWSLGFDPRWNRDVGYGVPAVCDHPDCTAEIDRGLSHVCGDAAYGGEHGCGLHFCTEHLGYAFDAEGEFLVAPDGDELPNLCERCVAWYERQDEAAARDLFAPKADHLDWVRFKLTDASWQPWRELHPEQVAALSAVLGARSA